MHQTIVFCFLPVFLDIHCTSFIFCLLNRVLVFRISLYSLFPQDRGSLPMSLIFTSFFMYPGGFIFFISVDSSIILFAVDGT